MKKILILSALLASTVSFSQSKKELMEQVDKKNATIDSLHKVIANMENIIENRDRSNKILTEDVDELTVKLQEETDLRREKHAIIQKLRNRAATGVPKIMYMSNTKNVLKVPKGKYWTINQFMSDYTSKITIDSTGTPIAEEVHVFIKELDGTVLTNPAQKLYGPKVFSSLHPEQVIRFPLIFTEGVQFKIAVYKGEIGALEAYDGKVYCTYTEKDME
ncbi:MAG: hypothetical protein HUJ25_06510 [Crocinitomicaceae bacterium]|nr:hypothetical protein [Crocinitomicaceae bacterium]